MTCQPSNRRSPALDIERKTTLMAKKTLLLSLGPLILIILCGCASPGTGPSYSLSQGTRPPQTVRHVSGATARPYPIQSSQENSASSGLTLSNISSRIMGGQVVEANNDEIVVQAKDSKPSSDPVALTNDAIITTSIRTRIARQPRLKSGDFQITSTDGVVSIRSQADSLEDAVSVINLTLTVPDVRQIVYVLPMRA
jgi:BON domain